MPNRSAKQLIYGSLYLSILVVLFVWVYVAKLKPAPSCFDSKRNQGEEEADCGGPCEACVIRRLKPIELVSVQAFDAGNRTTAALLQFRNVNGTYGAKRISYRVDFYGRSGEILTTLRRDTFVYPGSIKYHVEFDIPLDPGLIVRSAAQVTNTVWEARERFSAPRLEAKAVHLEARPGQEQVIISGVLSNMTPLSVPRATVVAVVVNPLGLTVGASKTQIRDLMGLEDRSFQVVVGGIPEAAEINEQMTTLYFEGEW